METFLRLHSLVHNLSWNDSEKEELPSDFTSKPVHIALEKADKYHKWDIFRKIMDKDSNNKIALLHHIKNTAFYWNCKYQDFWREQYKDLYDECYSPPDNKPDDKRKCESCKGKLIISEDREPDCIECYKVVCDKCANRIPECPYSFLCPDCNGKIPQEEWDEL